MLIKKNTIFATTYYYKFDQYIQRLVVILKKQVVFYMNLCNKRGFVRQTEEGL